MATASLAAVAALSQTGAPLAAAQQSAGRTWRVNGVVMRAVDDTTRPVGGAWVVLHRVGRDGGAPVDSVQSDARGRYVFAYRVTADSAVYFASAMHDGVAYFTPPFTEPEARDAAAEVLVFDTSSVHALVATRSRHLIVFPGAARNERRVSEVYWIENRSARTRVGGRDSVTWRALLPAGARALSVDGGDIARDAVALTNGYVVVSSPLAPGIRQLQIVYDVPVRRNSLTVPMSDSVMVLEVLTEDARASAQGAGLAAQGAVTVEQQTFQRYLAQNVAAGAVFVVAAARGTPSTRAMLIAVMVTIVGMAILARLARTMMRAPAGAAPERRGHDATMQSLAREIASLDEQFERKAAPSDDERAAYTAQRDELKARLTTLLAERDDRV